MLHDSPLEDQEVCDHDIAHYRKQGASMLITVPKSLRHLLNWRNGELLIVSVVTNSLVIVPAQRRIIEAIEQSVKETGPLN
jgi:antitoxin component of MazEF toxin-antitoxin module